MLKLQVVCWLLFFSIVSYGQEERQSTVIMSIAEQLAEEENDQGSAEIFADILRTLTEDPVDINSADENEVSRLFFLTGFQVKVICDYVRRTGKIMTIYEIANIPGFDMESVKMMIPFITLTGNPIYLPDTVRLQNSLLANISFRPGNNDSSFNGSPVKLLSRYRFTAGRFSGGITIEKDHGERLISGKIPLPDFFSANLSYSGHGFIRKIIAGDFSARFGQGLALNTSATFGYSLTAATNLCGRDEIRPYTSADENNFFRGMALVAGGKRTLVSVFLSVNMIDATLSKPEGGENNSVSNLYTSGIHNTLSTLMKKDNLKEYAAGFNVSRSFRNLNLGFLISYNRFSLPFATKSESLQALYGFRGKTNTLYSGYYSMLAGKFIFSGEVCYGGGNKGAIMQNIAFRPAERLSLNLICRDYFPGFTSFHGKGLSGSSPVSEKGIAGSFSFEAAKYLFINAGTDLRIYPWLRYRNSAPSSAVRHEIRTRYIPSDKLNVELFYSVRRGYTDDQKETGLPVSSEKITRAARLQVRFQVLDNITLTSRIDYKTYSPARDKGISLLQDVSVKSGRVTFWFRYCIFSTDSFYTAVYAWENDLLYGFSIPALFGEGSRMYFMVKWNPFRILELRFKYGITSSKTTGANTNYNDEFKFQAVAKF